MHVHDVWEQLSLFLNMFMQLKLRCRLATTVLILMSREYPKKTGFPCFHASWRNDINHK